MIALWSIALAGQVRLAPTHWSIVHGAPTNPDSLDVQVPEGNWQIEKPVGLAVNPVAVLQGLDGVWWTSGGGSVVAMAMKPKLHEIARFKREPLKTVASGGMFHGAYSFVDDQNRFYAGFQSTIERYSLDTSNNTLRRSVKSLDGWEEGDAMVALNLGSGGHLVIATQRGNVFTKQSGEADSDADWENGGWFKLDLRTELGAKDQDLAVSNSVAMSGSGDVTFVPTALGLAAVNVDGKPPKMQSWWPIEPADKWYLNRLGPRGTGSSPTTFLLGDRQFVTVTDGLDSPMNLRVAEVTPGKMAEVASIGVEFPNGKSTSEQSVSVLVEGSSALMVVVQNFVGEDYFDLADPDVHGVVPRASLRLANHRLRKNATLRESKHAKAIVSGLELGAGSAGVNAYDFSGAELKLRWASKDVCAMTIIPLQTRGRVWLVGTLREDEWDVIYLLGLDATTGKVATRAELARGAKKSVRNPTYAGIGTDGESLVFGTFGGVVRARATTTLVV